MPVLIDRMIRAARLDDSLYWELRRDPQVRFHVLGAILIIGLASGFAQLPLRALRAGDVPLPTVLYVLSLGLLATVVWWLVLSGIYYWVGTRFLNGFGSLPAMLIALAFALTPGILQIVLVFIPALGWIGTIAISLWLYLSQATALRLTLGLAPGPAFIMVFATTFLLRFIARLILPGFFGF